MDVSANKLTPSLKSAIRLLSARYIANVSVKSHKKSQFLRVFIFLLGSSNVEGVLYRFFLISFRGFARYLEKATSGNQVTTGNITTYLYVLKY